MAFEIGCLHIFCSFCIRLYCVNHQLKIDKWICCNICRVFYKQHTFSVYQSMTQWTGVVANITNMFIYRECIVYQSTNKRNCNIYYTYIIHIHIHMYKIKLENNQNWCACKNTWLNNGQITVYIGSMDDWMIGVIYLCTYAYMFDVIIYRIVFLFQDLFACFQLNSFIWISIWLYLCTLNSIWHHCLPECCRIIICQ